MNVLLSFGIGYQQFEVSSFAELVESIIDEINGMRLEYPRWFEGEKKEGRDPIKEVAGRFIVDGIPASQIQEVVELVEKAIKGEA